MSDQYPKWKQKHFYGGFSDDRFIGIKNSYRYAKGVEVRKNPNSLMLAYANEAETIALTAKVNAMVTIKSTGDIIAFCNDGKIFRKIAGAGAWALVYTDTGAGALMNAFEYNDYLYWFTAGNVHRIAISSIDAAWAGTVTEDYKAFANANANAHPVIELNNNMYIGDGYYLAELDSLGTWTNNKLSIFHDEEIRAITFGGTTMRLFSRRSNKIDGGRKYYWNGTDASYGEKVWFRQIIHTAINDGGNDYVIAGLRPFLYLSSGYDFIPKKRLPLVADTQELFIAPNAIDFYDNLLVFGAGESGDGEIGRGVWTWGKETNNYVDILNFEYPTSNDNSTDKIFCVHQSGGVLYSCWTNSAGTTFGIDKVNTSKYRATGQLSSLVHYGFDADNEKTAVLIKDAFDTLAAGEKVEVYLRKNLASAWEDTAELTASYADEDDRSINFKEKDEALEIGDYIFLETKILLTAGTDQLTTPELMALTIEFDPNTEKGD